MEAEQKTRQVILKYPLGTVESSEDIVMPAGARILSAGWHDGELQLWVLADPEVPKVHRRVCVRSTGHEVIGEEWEYFGTVVAPRKRVFHVFVEIL
jgi:hypothetical protein